MRNNIHPNQISFFDSREDRGSFTRERERERERVGSIPRCHIYDNIISIENLLDAWREFLCGKRKRKDVEEFSLYLMDNIILLHQDLKNKAYRHGPYQAFKINDPKPRDIHKASVRDRMVHHAIYRILYPYFDSKFIFDSFSCRKEKGTHRAMNRFQEYARKVSCNHTKTVWVLKCDIRKFFASIDHEILIGILRKHIEDNNTIWVLREIIESFHSKNNFGIGLPLGNLTSQILVNIYMNEFDHFLKRELKIKYCVRYADDFVIFDKDKKYLENILSPISQFLETRLKLSIHPDKVSIKTIASGIDFLGWVHFPHHRVLRTSTKKRMFKKLSGNPSKETMASYLGLIGHGDSYKLREKILK